MTPELRRMVALPGGPPAIAIALPRILGPRAERDRMAARIVELEATVEKLERSLSRCERRRAADVQRLADELHVARRKIASLGCLARDPADPDMAVVAKLLATAAAASGVPEAEILGPGRSARIAAVRQWVYFEGRAAGLSLQGIGLAMGRHHTSVLSGIRQEAKRRARRG